MIGGGVGVWQGRTAYAIGLSKSDGSGRFALKGGAVVTSQGQVGGSAGFGIRF
jgi:autotransporter adhesin